jgi:hypothetical protein
LNGRVGIHGTVAVVCHGVAQNIQLKSVELEVPAVHWAAKLAALEPWSWHLSFCLAKVFTR